MRIYNLWLAVIVLLSASWRTVNGNAGDRKLIRNKFVVIVDKILEAYKLAIIASGNSRGEIILDDMGKEFSPKLLGLFKTNFLASNGHLSSVLSIKRLGTVSVEQRPNRVTFKTSVGFNFLKIVYDSFVIRLPFKGKQEGKIEIVVRDCVLQLEIEAVFGQRCTVRLTDLKITDFGRLIPTVTGMKPNLINSVVGGIMNTFLDVLVKKGKLTVEKYFYHNVREAIGLIDVCSILREHASTEPVSRRRSFLPDLPVKSFY